MRLKIVKLRIWAASSA